MTSKRARRIDEIGEESRRRILDAAEELFAEKGFERTSFVDIAERSGISRGSIPWHFQNKDGLLIAVVERAVERDIPPDLFGPDTADFRSVLAEVAKLLRPASASLMYMVLTEAMTSEGTVHDQYVEFFRHRRDRIADWVLASHAERRPRTRAELNALAAAINGAVLGLHLQWTLDPNGVDLDAGLDALGALVEARLGLPDGGKAGAGQKARNRKGATA